MQKLKSGSQLYAAVFIVFLMVFSLNHWVFSKKSSLNRNKRVIASDETLPPSYLREDWEQKAADILSQNPEAQGFGQEPDPMESLLLGDLKGKSYVFDTHGDRITQIDFRPSPIEVQEGASLQLESQMGAEIPQTQAFVQRHRQLFDGDSDSVKFLGRESGDEGPVESFELFALGASAPVAKVVMQLDYDNRLLSLSVQ